MGCDFSALLKVNSEITAQMHAIRTLESDPNYSPLDTVIEYGRTQDYAFACPGENLDLPAWFTYPKRERLSIRPVLPSTEVSLELRSNFALMWGTECIWVYHSVRWYQFLTDAGWRQNLLSATKHFYDLFGSTDCIITRDEHESITAFLNGASFDASLATVAPEEGPVATFEDLFVDEGVDDELVYRRPEGDYAVPLWDSYGYWHFNPDQEFNKQHPSTSHPAE